MLSPSLKDDLSFLSTVSLLTSTLALGVLMYFLSFRTYINICFFVMLKTNLCFFRLSGGILTLILLGLCDLKRELLEGFQFQGAGGPRTLLGWLSLEFLPYHPGRKHFTKMCGSCYCSVLRCLPVEHLTKRKRKKGRERTKRRSKEGREGEGKEGERRGEQRRTQIAIH